MQKKLSFLIALSLCSLTLVATRGLALGSNNQAFQCLADAEGQYLKWSAAWQKDSSDQGVIYSVARATRLPSKRSSPHLVLELQAVSERGFIRANIQTRQLSVTEKSRLPGFCNNLSSNKHSLRRSSNLRKTHTKKVAKRASTENEGLEFIEYRGGKWVRGEAPARQKTTSCYILDKRFSCLMSDKTKHEKELVDLEAEIAISSSLEY